MPIHLREMTDEDLELFFHWQSDADAVRMAAFTSADPSDREAFDRHRERIRLDPDVLERAICDEQGLAGMVASFTIEGDRELTYWVDPARWGQGIASEGLRQFLRLETRRPVYARVAEHNIGSASVVRRLGFVECGEDSAWANGVARIVTEKTYRLD
jgi:RimJ/RimL family protein N-acetyltransferase